MTIPITLSNIGSIPQNPTSAETTINSNSAAITTAFNSALSTSGDQMQGNLDMNGFQILNQGVTSYTVATLPTSPNTGRIAVVTDGTSGLSWGSTLTGGHSTVYLVWWNSSAWTVIGK